MKLPPGSFQYMDWPRRLCYCINLIAKCIGLEIKGIVLY